MKGFNVTFERVTPESAEHGEPESRGFVAEGLSLRDALRECGGTFYPQWEHLGQCEPSASDYRAARWYTFPQFNEGTTERYEGTEESRSLHIPESVTPSSRLRIARLIGASVPRNY